MFRSEKEKISKMGKNPETKFRQTPERYLKCEKVMENILMVGINLLTLSRKRLVGSVLDAIIHMNLKPDIA